MKRGWFHSPSPSLGRRGGDSFPKVSCEHWAPQWLVSQVDICLVRNCYLLWAPHTGELEVGLSPGGQVPHEPLILKCGRGLVTLGPQSSGATVAWGTRKLPHREVVMKCHSWKTPSRFPKVTLEECLGTDALVNLPEPKDHRGGRVCVWVCVV